MGFSVHLSTGAATLFPKEVHANVARHALEKWAEVVVNSPRLAKAVPASALRHPPLARHTISSIIRIGELAGSARWCGVAEDEVDRLERSAKRYGLDELKTSYAIALLAFTRNSAKQQLSKDPCNATSRKRLKKWFKRNVTWHVNLSQSAPNALTRLPNRIPPELVGVWASSGSVFENERVTRGRGLYIGADGLGWQQILQSGSGRRVLLHTASNATQIIARQTEHTIVVTQTKLRVHRANGEITIIDANGVVFRRVHNVFDSEVRVSLGVEPARATLERYFNSHRAINAFYRTYWLYEGHKAFAVSAGGSYGYSGQNMLSRQAAIDQAMMYCNQYRAANAPTCRVLSVGNELMIPRPEKRALKF